MRSLKFSPKKVDLYLVHPQYLKTGSKESTDYIVYYEVLLENVPVFVLELRAPTAINFISTGEEADNQIRKRLGDLARG